MITQQLISDLFAYQEDGVLIKKTKRRGNTMGSVAGTANGCGYLQVAVNKRVYLVHRLVFLLHNGWLPKQVDHANGDKRDNRIGNLRAADAVTNAQNRRRPASNTSGEKNVSFDKAKGKFRVVVKFDGKNTGLGYFATLAEAAEVARAARDRHHGEFANHG